MRWLTRYQLTIARFHATAMTVASNLAVIEASADGRRCFMLVEVTNRSTCRRHYR